MNKILVRSFTPEIRKKDEESRTITFVASDGSRDTAHTEWASRNMFVLGIIVVVGLCFHLSHFWAKMQLPEIMGAEAEYAGQFADGAALIKTTFSNPIICLGYIIWLAAVWFHLTHGFWSAFQTIGWNGKTWFPRLKCVANVVATLIFLCFGAVVVSGYIQSL